jgi:SAM-dependent methyltransferase
VGKESFEIVNYSAYGLAVIAPEGVDMPNKIKGAAFVVADVELAQVDLRLIRNEKFGSASKAAFEITNEALSCESVCAILETHALIDEHKSMFLRYQVLPATFKERIYEICFRLADLERKVGEMEAKQKSESLRDQAEFEETSSQVLAEHIGQVFSPLFDEIDFFYKTFTERDLRVAFSFFRECLKDQLFQSPFASRSFHKPLGYAGDFEMMNILYRDENVGKGLFAKSIHRFYMRHPNARAVRNRVQYLGEKIRETIGATPAKSRSRILSVASGPAREVQAILDEMPLESIQRAEFTLLDQDLKALQHAKSQIRTICRRRAIEPPVAFTNLAIKNVITDGLSETYDLIYSAGLFDYFSDPVADHAGRQLYRALRPGGRLIIGNFHSSISTRAIMDFALDWQLIYRSEVDLRRLYGGLGGNVQVESEVEGVNLFVVITKPSN